MGSQVHDLLEGRTTQEFAVGCCKPSSRDLHYQSLPWKVLSFNFLQFKSRFSVASNHSFWGPVWGVLSVGGMKLTHNPFELFFSSTFMSYISIWWFPEIGVPPNHPFELHFPSSTNHFVVPLFMDPPHIFQCFHLPNQIWVNQSPSDSGEFSSSRFRKPRKSAFRLGDSIFAYIFILDVVIRLLVPWTLRKPHGLFSSRNIRKDHGWVGVAP